MKTTTRITKVPPSHRIAKPKFEIFNDETPKKSKRNPKLKRPVPQKPNGE